MERGMEQAMKKKVSLSWLLAFYGEMLTENQREMSRLHWEEDLTLTEIAQQFSISRQSVHDTITRTEKQLEGLEGKLGLLRRFQAVEEGLKACDKELAMVVPANETGEHLDAARRWIKALLDQEEQ
ncbi:MAG: DNA-binding protein [Clostridia bacterium]|nr:DNA-binding protein [Clostridia bacterium]